MRSQKTPLFSVGLPHNKVAAQVARQASLFQIKDTKDAHKENFATVFGFMGENMDTDSFFCVVTERQGLQRGRLPTESTTVGRDGDAYGVGEQRWGDGSQDTTVAVLEGTYYIRN